MFHDARPQLEDEELTVLRMDYQRLLRDSKAAFESGNAREGLRLLDLAAIFERDTRGSLGRSDSARSTG